MTKSGRFIPRNTAQETFFNLYGDEQIKIIAESEILSIRVKDLFRIFRDRIVAELQLIKESQIG